MADAAQAVRRFYETATTAPSDRGIAILLDGRPVKTPARHDLAVPSARLGEAIAEEWSRQGEKVDPRSMPLTGLANAAIDRVSPDPGAFAAGLAGYGESDLLYYRAEGPAPLAAREAELWDPILAWARRRYDAGFELASGVIHRPQPRHTVEQLAAAVAARTPFELVGLWPLVTISGSLVIALALAEGAVTLDEAWAAAALDELWQIETWGADKEAVRNLESRRREFEAAYLFLTLL